MSPQEPVQRDPEGSVPDPSESADPPEYVHMEDTTHWLTRFGPDDGEPYGTVCHCDIGLDHYGNGELTFPPEGERAPSANVDKPVPTATETTEAQAHLLADRSDGSHGWVPMEDLTEDKHAAEKGYSDGYGY